MSSPFQVCAGTVSGSSPARTVPVANPSGAGDTLLALVVVNNTTCTVSGFSDSAGNVYTLDKSYTSAFPTLYAFRSPGATGGAGGGATAALPSTGSVSATTAAASGNVEIYVASVPGAGAVDQISNIAAGSSATPSAAATPGHDNEICVSYFATANAGGAPAVNTPFSSLGTWQNGTNPYTTAAAEVLGAGTSGAAQTSTLTIVSANWRAGMWTFQAGSSGAKVSLTEQHADATPVISAAVVVTEQHADLGGGSQAGVRLIDQAAVTASVRYAPSSIGASDGSRQWQPRYVYPSDGIGIWNGITAGLGAGIVQDQAGNYIFDQASKAVTA